MIITLLENGREMILSEEAITVILKEHFSDRGIILSEEAITAILKEHFDDETSKTEEETTKGVQTENKETKPTKTIAKGKYFDVIPSSIDRSLFQEKRENKQQEWTRQFILEAFDKVYSYPKKYAKPFKLMIPELMIPEKIWVRTDLQELLGLDRKLGDHIADWVELALVWAQRISNGDTWEDLCNNNKLDTRICSRLFKWMDGFYRLVAGTEGTEIYYKENLDCRFLDNTIPLFVSYEEDCPVPDRIAS